MSAWVWWRRFYAPFTHHLWSWNEPFSSFFFFLSSFFRSRFGSRTGDPKWRRSWKTASFHQSTAPAPATPWPATRRSPRPCGTRRAPPGRTAYSHKTSTRRLLTFWTTRRLGTPPPAAPWLPTFRPLTRYSTRWLLEPGRYTEKQKQKKTSEKEKKNNVVHFVYYYVFLLWDSCSHFRGICNVSDDSHRGKTCKMCKCVHVIYCIFGRLLNV